MHGGLQESGDCREHASLRVTQEADGLDDDQGSAMMIHSKTYSGLRGMAFKAIDSFMYSANSAQEMSAQEMSAQEMSTSSTFCRTSFRAQET